MSLAQRRAAVACALYFASGAAGLIVEQVFERLLTTVIGTSVEAAAVVLTVYFAGVSAGALLFPLARRRGARPLAIYAGAEAVAGALSIGLALGFGPIQRASVWLLHAIGTEGAALSVSRVLVAACFVGPPALAVGLTFPAVSAFAEGRPETRRLMSVFYALNVGGGVVAAMSAPYLLFPSLGLTTTVGLAGAAQLLVAVVAARMPAPDAVRAGEAAGEAGPPRDRALLLTLSFASGALVFGFEVLWVHLIGVTLGMSVYAFSMMLALVLAGLFLGGTIGAALPARAHGDAALAAAFLAAGAAAAIVFPAWGTVGERLLEGGAFVRTFADAEALRYRQAAVLLGVPATCLGLAYPALIRSPRFPVGDAARFAARLGVANAVGSAVGAMGVAHALLPRIGSEQTYRALVGAALLLGGALAAASLRRPGRTRLVVLSALALSALAALPARARWDRLTLTSGAHVYLHGMFVRRGTQLRFWHEDAVGGVTTVVANPSGDGEIKYLLTNGKFQGSDRGETAAQTSFALLPITATERRSRALVIGLGTGHTASALTAVAFSDVDVLELAPGIVAAARAEFSALNHGVLDEPRAHVVLEDGRNFLLRGAHRYDLVSIEVSSIWFAGATNIYSRQFYELARGRLTPGGVLAQWVQVHHTSRDDFLCVVRTVAAAFPHVAVWYLGGQGVVLASEAPLRFRPEAMPAVLSAKELEAGLEALRRSGVDPAKVFDAPLFDEAATARLIAAAARLGVPLNTDENRRLEYSSPRHNFGAPSTEELLESLRALAAEPAKR